jgi:hypothetical protein
MKMTAEQKRHFAIRLEKVGCPVETPLETAAGPGGIIIQALECTGYGCMALDCGLGGSGVLLSLSLSNDSDRRISLADCEYSLTSPWGKFYFKYFVEPDCPVSSLSPYHDFKKRYPSYSFPGTSLAVEETEVMNHRRDELGVGESTEGLLVDYSKSLVPKSWKEGNEIVGRFIFSNPIVGAYYHEISLRVTRKWIQQPRPHSLERRINFGTIDSGHDERGPRSLITGTPPCVVKSHETENCTDVARTNGIGRATAESQGGRT